MKRIARRAIAPVEEFLATEAASGIVLLATALCALAVANSRWRTSFEHFWHRSIGLSMSGVSFHRDLHFWVNDGLMTIFFFVVGLEIKREIHRGELQELRRAALPVAAAVGGMIVPACIYFALNVGRASESGWGIPMATDIAFALGVLTLLGRRVPPALRVLLLALAIIDDVGAILVIALFYSASFSLAGFLVAALALAGIGLMKRIGLKQAWMYLPTGILLWAGAYSAGVHPTLAGVVLGVLTPVEGAAGNVAEKLQKRLHRWVAFGIMPIFAFANAGVSLGNVSVSGSDARVFAGIALGLLVGKPIGIVGISWLGHRIGLLALPRGTTFAQIGLVGLAAGIGFTMALFIGGLALTNPSSLETAKFAVLIGSTAAGVSAFIYGHILLPKAATFVGARTESDAEASTED